MVRQEHGERRISNCLERFECGTSSRSQAKHRQCERRASWMDHEGDGCPRCIQVCRFILDFHIQWNSVSAGPGGRPELHTYVEKIGDRASNDVKLKYLSTDFSLTWRWVPRVGWPWNSVSSTSTSDQRSSISESGLRAPRLYHCWLQA